MPKLTPEQRAKRREAMQAEALRWLSERGVVEARVSPEDYVRIHKCCAALGKNMGAVLRQWILEKLNDAE